MNSPEYVFWRGPNVSRYENTNIHPLHEEAVKRLPVLEDLSKTSVDDILDFAIF